MILGFIVWIIMAYLLIECLKDVLPDEFINNFRTKSEYIICVIFGAMLYIKEVLSPTNTEKAIIKRQTEIALRNFKDNLESLKLVCVMLAVMLYEMFKKKCLEKRISVYKLNISENISITEVYDYNDDYNMYYNIA